MPADPNQGHARNPLLTETVNPVTADIDHLSPLEIVQVMQAEDAKIAAAIAPEMPQIAQAIAVIAERLRQGGRLIYTGAGTSGRLGALDAYECPPTFNTPPEMVVGLIAGGAFERNAHSEELEDSAAAGEADLAACGVSGTDVVVGVAASGRTPYVLGAIAYAKQRGAVTVGLVCNAATPLAQLADIPIAPVVGPEVIAGSTRLKAGTAQKMVLNMLSTGAMILLGKTYGNLMVDVQATNEKLQQRASAIVQRITGLDAATATALLAASDYEVKTAIVAGRAQVAPDEARARLAANGNNLRATLEAAQ